MNRWINGSPPSDGTSPFLSRLKIHEGNRERVRERENQFSVVE